MLIHCLINSKPDSNETSEFLSSEFAQSLQFEIDAIFDLYIRIFGTEINQKNFMTNPITEIQTETGKTTLRNGLTVVTEQIDSVRSISVGIWIKTGSRNESEKMAGVTHFLEHMVNL